MMQVAIGVAAGVMLAAFLSGCSSDSPSLLTKSSPSPKLPFEVAGDGVDVQLPSSQAAPPLGFGTPIAGAGPMPSARKYTHNMFEQ